MNIIIKKILSFFSLSYVFLILTLFPAQSASSSDWAFSFLNQSQLLSPITIWSAIAMENTKSTEDTYSWSNIVELSDFIVLSSGKGVTIALIDSGIDIDNPLFTGALWQNGSEVYNNGLYSFYVWLQSNLPYSSVIDCNIIQGDGLDNDVNGYIDDINGWNFGDSNNIITDETGHGTNVAGILLKCAPEAKLMVLKVNPGNFNVFYIDALVDAIYYAVKNGADIINMSLCLANESRAVKNAILYAVNSGVIVVSAAGNSPSEIAFPGIMEEVITVGATNADGSSLLWSSPKGGAIDITAPGKSVETVGLNGEIVFVTGTSFSAPMVSGAIAALLGMNNALKPATIESLIFHGAGDMGDDGRDDEFGWGILSGSEIRELSIPAITVKKIVPETASLLPVANSSTDNQFEISCYLPPTDSYTDVYIALVKTQDTEEYKNKSIDKPDEEYIWWLDSDGIWKGDNDFGITSIASLRLDNNGLSVLLFSDSGGIWKNFSPYGFETGRYNIGIAVTGASGLLAPVFWSPAMFF